MRARDAIADCGLQIADGVAARVVGGGKTGCQVPASGCGRPFLDFGPGSAPGGVRMEEGGRRQSAIRHPPSTTGRHLLPWVLALSAGGLLGCAQNVPQRQYYVLVAEPPAPPAAVAPGQAVLLVLPFSVDAAFTGRQLVYRVTDFRYETDYYHQFLIPPGQMLTEKTRGWLADTGLFRQVVAPGNVAAPTYTLTGNVTALYGDFAPPAAPTAVLEIRFALLAAGGGGDTPVFTESYRVRTPVADRTADAVIAALDQDFTEILTRLTADLREVLAGRADRPAGNG